MTAPVFQIAVASPEVTALLGVNPTRLWDFGEAPKNADGTVASGYPYAVWQLAYGSPENTLSCPPRMDNYGIQIDVYGRNAASARAVKDALRDAYEFTGNHVVAWNGETRDRQTNLYRVSFTVEFFTQR